MKTIHVFLIVLIVFSVSAQHFEIRHNVDIANRQDVTMEYLDSIISYNVNTQNNLFEQINIKKGLQLDLSNTICDTLVFNDKIILLDRSPLLNLSAFDEHAFPDENIYVDNDTNLRQKGIEWMTFNSNRVSCYNCERGYVAKWIIRGNKLYLSDIHSQNSNTNKNFWIEKVERTFHTKFNKELEIKWINGEIRGGNDCFPSIFGNTYKNEYVFYFKKGEIQKCEITSIPTGKYEYADSLLSFFDNYCSYSDYMNYWYRHTFSVVSDIFGKPSFFISEPLRQHLYLLEQKRTSIEQMLLLQKQMFESMPENSMYGRFIQGGKIFSAHIYDWRYSRLLVEIYGEKRQ